MDSSEKHRSLEILLVEDNPGDVLLVKEALKEINICNMLNVVRDGLEALDYLHCAGKYSNAVRPDIMLLDLNLPKKDGREALEEIKKDEGLKAIPVVVLSTSDAENDIIRAYKSHANCYITKPINFDKFVKTIRYTIDFWSNIVRLPWRG